MTRSAAKRWLILAIGMILFGIYALTAHCLIGTGCVFTLIFGVPCPACGMTRAMLALLSWDMAGAFAMHPLFPLCFAIFFLLIRITAKPDVAHRKWFPIVCVLIAAAFVIVYAVRMILYFPGHAPMQFRKESLLGLLLRNFSLL